MKRKVVQSEELCTDFLNIFSIALGMIQILMDLYVQLERDEVILTNGLSLEVVVFVVGSLSLSFVSIPESDGAYWVFCLRKHFIVVWLRNRFHVIAVAPIALFFPSFEVIFPQWGFECYFPTL